MVAKVVQEVHKVPEGSEEVRWCKRFIRYRRVLKDLGGAKIHMVPEGSEGVRWCRWRMYVVT